MANQLQITGDTKVKSLSGVLTGTSGLVGSVPLGAANGVATLDSGGKVPVSQLPSSVVTYLGTWNAATNTPTLVNGVGDAGDMYICNVAGTVNFGAGPVTFAVGDWVLYGSGTWQKSNGQNGTVTSVGASITGNAIGLTGSPITTAGTLAFAFSGTSGQYVNGAGNLTTFPTLITSIGLSMPSAFSVANSPLTANGSINVTGAGTTSQYIDGTGALQTFPALTGYVPYTGATTDVDLGTHVLNAQALHVKGTAGAGHLGLKHQTASPTGSANESLIFADVNGNLGWQNDNLYLTTLVSNANTANRSYTFPNASGTLALTSDISYPVTSVFGRTGAVTAQSGDYTTTLVTEGTRLYYTDTRARAALSFTAGSGAYNSTTGVITIPTNTSQLTNGANFITLASLSAGTGISYNNLTGVISSTITQYTDAMARAAISGGTGISYNSTTGVIANTITQYTDALARAAISLTTTGTSGAATYNSTTGVLNIPQYTDAYTGTVTSVAMTVPTGLSVSGSPITTSGTLAVTLTAGYSIPTTASQTNWDTAYTNRITSATSPLSITSNVISISQATTSTSGYLSSTDWNTFNSKQGTITLTTTGTSGAATLVSNTLNIPNYTLSGLGGIGGSGTTNYLPKFTAGTTIGNSIIQDASTYIDVAGYAFFRRGGKYLILNPNVSNANTYADIGVDAGMGITFTPNAGSAAMTLTSSGNLGLGVTPVLKLDVQGNAADTTTISGVTVEQITLFRPSNGVGGIRTGFNTTTGDAYLWSAQSSANLYLGSRVAPNNNANVSIFSDGNVGIGTGTTNAGYKLDVNGTGRFSDGTQGLIVRSYTGGAGYGAIYASTLTPNGSNPALIASSTSTFLNANTGGNVYLSIGTVAALTISSTGAATFSSSVTQSYGIFTGVTPAYPTSGQGIIDGNGGNLRLFGYADINFYNNGTQNMVIKSGGNVGIGTTSPEQLLTVAGGSISVSGNTGLPRQILELTTASTVSILRASYQGAGSFGDMALWTGGSERMRITSSGVVAIGTTTNLGGGNLEVQTNGVSAFTARSSSTTGANGGTTVVSVRSVDSSASYWANAQYNAWQQIFCVSGSTEAMRITSGGNVLIGTTTDSGQKLRVFGDGANFGNGSDFYQTINSGTTGSYYLIVNGAIRQTIASTGAATFSSSAEAVITWARTSCKNWALASDSAGGYFKNTTDSVIPIYMTNAGNVGIGTTNPTAKLQVQGVYGNVAAIFSGITTASQSFGVYINAGTNVNDYAFSVSNAAETTNFFKIKGNGTATFYSTIQTGGFGSSSARPWRLGELVSATVIGVNTTGYLTVEVNGSQYNLALANLA